MVIYLLIQDVYFLLKYGTFGVPPTPVVPVPAVVLCRMPRRIAAIDGIILYVREKIMPSRIPTGSSRTNLLTLAL